MSVQLIEDVSGKCIELKLSGKLTKDDYAKFVPDIERQIKEHGKVRILVDMHDFQGWKMRALWEDVKFDVKHFADIDRIAMVGEKTWQGWMAVFCKPFTKAKIQYFSRDEAEQARAWLEGE